MKLQTIFICVSLNPIETSLFIWSNASVRCLLRVLNIVQDFPKYPSNFGGAAQKMDVISKYKCVAVSYLYERVCVFVRMRFCLGASSQFSTRFVEAVRQDVPWVTSRFQVAKNASSK